MPKPWIPAFLLAAVAAVAADKPFTPPFETAAEPAPRGRIDELVFARLQSLSIQPAHPCSDEVFLRRAYLDVIGTLPTSQEAAQFLADADPHKRAALVDRLLDRPEFADFWAMKWSDLLRVKSEFPIDLWPNAVQAYYRWIRTSIAKNTPYDRFVREMLTANGSNFREAPVNFYRAVQSKEPQAIAQAVALTFMGTRAELWPQPRLEAMAGFFSRIGFKHTGEWKEEIVYFDPSTPAQTAVFPDGKTARIAPDQDPREVFANWLLAPDNPWFARAIVNRIWYWLLGRGIIHEPDDIRPDNPPANPELLAYLEKELVASHYDLKHIFRIVLTSETYGAFRDTPERTPRGRRELRLLPAAPPGRGDAHRRHLPDHRHNRAVLQPHPGTLHLPAGRAAFHSPARWQHRQRIPRNVRAAAARYRPRIGAQQPAHGRAAPAPAQFHPHPGQDPAKPRAARAAASPAGRQAARSH